MIEVKRTESGVTITGHAGYAPHGQDIVCAAVSTLVGTFLWSIDGLTDDVINSFTEPGKAVIKYGNLSERGNVLLDSFFIGIEIVANEYPDYVKIVQA